MYIETPRSLVGHPGSPFVSPRCRPRPISKNAVSFFLSVVIIESHALGTDEGPGPGDRGIRGVTTSYVFHRHWSVDTVLHEAKWRSDPLFASFSLRPVSLLLLYLYVIIMFMYPITYDNL